MSAISQLSRILAEVSLQRGHFTLASGKTSSFYIDARLTTMSPEGMVLIGRQGLDEIRRRDWEPDAVGGLTLGADPIAYAISHTSATDPKPIRAFTVRKESKGHGTARLIEGPFRQGDAVVIVEDVITTGHSAIQAIDAVEAAGGRILGVLAVVDREDGGREAINARGYDVCALTNVSDLMAVSAPGHADE